MPLANDVSLDRFTIGNVSTPELTNLTDGDLLSVQRMISILLLQTDFSVKIYRTVHEGEKVIVANLVNQKALMEYLKCA